MVHKPPQLVPGLDVVVSRLASEPLRQVHSTSAPGLSSLGGRGCNQGEPGESFLVLLGSKSHLSHVVKITNATHIQVVVPENFLAALKSTLDRESARERASAGPAT